MGYVAVNLEVASCSSFRDNEEKYFLTQKLVEALVALTLFVADREVADDVISSNNVDFTGLPCC